MTIAATSNTPWPIVKLGDVCEFVGGGTPSKSHPEYYDGDIPWATVRDMNCKVIEKTERSITKEGVAKSATNIIKAGQLVISTHVGLGKVCYLAKDTAINQDLKAVIPIGGELCVDFLYVYFLTMADFILSKGTGSTVKGVKLDFIKNLPIPLPPLEVQREIVAKVEKGLAEADALTAHFKRMATLADETFKAELDETFQALSAPTVKLGDVCEVKAGQSPDGANYTSNSSFVEFHQGCKAFGLKFLHSSNVYTKEVTKLANAGSIVMSVRAPVGTVNITQREICIGRGLCTFIPASSLSRDYLYNYLLASNEKLNKAAGAGSVFPSISRKQLMVFPIPLPSLDEQQVIVAKLEAVKAKCERLKAEAERGVKAAEALRKAVLAEAFER